ncbi:hypothetical protein NLY43_06945 [Mesorhizobium sp. C416B]|uniref:hypothetical protein n=1 Tax=unclassified Mesorhizobium TaxID=325217 RepID=UPI0003CED2BA|nr:MULTISPECIES: hypothetical protein [unclassified Mesorhizobium]ESX46665.1 hypothetical protein X762_21505 [Mesorhizobium sp. LSHC426A00]ESX54464.1 hypothetical protein X761_16735 [Mesorhizobium sp. LSHC424B00]ESX72366.1 hypothetical protein X758_14680 [Mesorhizobium sp. LSHC416B00]WJI64492.1 hypothetical protein NLY43_06945 [Mesorhizobium sp. C416B]
MRKFVFFTLAFLPSLAFADDKPPGTVYALNEDEKTAIVADCDVPVDSEMTCHFRQMTVSKPDEAKSEERISKAVGDLSKASDREFKDCPKFAALVEAMESGKPPPEGDPEAFKEKWGKEPPQSKTDTLAIMKAFVTLCAKRDPASAEAVARASENVEGSTCSITNWTFDKTFRLNFSTEKWQSTVQNSDPCGTIDYAELSKATDTKGDYNFWNYTAKTLVTNQTGKTMLGASCTTVDQREHKFIWQTGKFYANCRYLQLSP